MLRRDMFPAVRHQKNTFRWSEQLIRPAETNNFIETGGELGRFKDKISAGN